MLYRHSKKSAYNPCRGPSTRYSGFMLMQFNPCQLIQTNYRENSYNPATNWAFITLGLHDPWLERDRSITVKLWPTTDPHLGFKIS